jgi:ribose transport system permease protein
MSSVAAERPISSYFDRVQFGRWRGTLIAFAVFLTAVVLMAVVSPKPFSYFNISTVTASAGALALAGMGETIIVLGGGLDLSVGAVISLVNVLLVTQIGASTLPVVPYTVAATVLALGVGGAIGAINGVLIGYLRLQSIVVTLATMFIVQGVVLLIMKNPGGEVSNDFSNVMVGDVIPDVLPAPIVVMVLAILVWLYLKRTRFGLALYAVGSDPLSAAANRVDGRLTTLLSYTVAGVFFGWAGLFLTANIGAGDPLIGTPMLLKVFAVVVLGGTMIGGGRGGCVGTVFGALTLTLIVNIILVMGIRDYYAPIIEGVVLIFAALGFSFGRDTPMLVAIRQWGGKTTGRPPDAPPIILHQATATSPPSDSVAYPNWFVRNAETIRLVLPSYVLLLVTIAITAAIYGMEFRFGDYLRTLVTFGSFLAVLGLGQGAVVLVGGLDLSVVWTITLTAIIATTPSCGDQGACYASQAALWPIPMALLAGAVIGLVNGSLVVGFRLSPVVATLAVGGILEGMALLYNLGAQGGGVPHVLKSFVTERIGPLPLIIWLLPVFIAFATLLLNYSTFGRRLYAIGNSPWVAKLSGVRTGRVIIGAYVLSGVCSAAMGLLLAGFTEQTFFDMGRPYLLASIAVVLLGGTSITGGRGHYLGILGGALLFTSLGSMLAGTSLPEAVRSIVYGVIILGVVVLLRDRRPA